MEIRNAIIITDANSQLRMSIDEQKNFTGNVIFARDKLPRAVADELARAVGRSGEDNAAATDLGGMAVKPELVG